MEKIKNLIEYVVHNAIYGALDELREDVVKGSNIVKVDGKWRIKSGKNGKLWKAHYDSKKDAEDGLKAYHANESRKASIKSKINEISQKYKALCEELSFDECNECGDDDTDFEIVDDGDAAIDLELSTLGPDENQYIDDIRKSALSAMADLADESDSEQFALLNKIFNMCQSLQLKSSKATIDMEEK
jgi:hypothetical protein